VSIGNVKIEAIPETSSGRGTAITLIPSSSLTTIPLTAVHTGKLSEGTYVLRVSSVGNPAISDESDSFTVNGPAFSVSSSNDSWISGASASVNLVKSNVIGNVKILVIRQSNSVGQVIFGNVSSKGEIVIPAEKTKLLSTGTYVLEAQSLKLGADNQPAYVVQSDKFEVREPEITITTPEMWAKGNKETLVIGKESGVGAVSVTAINSAGTRTILVPSSTASSIVIAKSKTTLLTKGEYTLEVKSIQRPSIVKVSNEFEVRDPLIAVTNLTTTWRLGSQAKIKLDKDALVTGPVSFTAIRLDDNNVPTEVSNDDEILLPTVTTKGDIIIPIAKVNLLSPGTYKVEARTTQTGKLYRSSTDAFTVAPAVVPATARSASSAISNVFTSIMNIIKAPFSN
jgi:hypothetical protein